MAHYEAAEHFQASLRIWPRNPNAEQNLAIIRQMREDQRRQGGAQG